MTRLRLLVVDDQELLRRGLRMLLDSTGEARVVAEARDGAHALALLARTEVDAVLTDMVMPGMDGPELIRRCAEQFPGLPVLALTTFDTEAVVSEALAAGAAGLLLKDTSPETVVAAVRTALSGGLHLDPRVARTALAGPREPAPDPLASLTDAERAVADCVADGLSNPEIARRLHLAPGTVKNYVSTLLRKLDAADRTQLALALDRARRS
ncbi:response regulator transcription factor [Propioniciclava coleopterorum]|uniref:Response regulator transcription factor n=1 Tax=Propioniciclava coleopterorum TaxID=2714937 RepID=A0A6G7Y6T7_9ACTN|nr:response regulator transcription factor [Propioniciclava coleopterorum]QIK72525.1 response regulator transcription factor [Propioniciclava coleopterorum]